MARSCKVCQHKDRKAIETKIIRGISHTVIGREYGISNMSVRYHTSRHLPKKLIASEEAREHTHSTTMFDNIMELVDKTKGILDRAEAKGKSYLSLTAIRELRSTYEFMCKISAYLHEHKDNDEKLIIRLTADKLGKGLTSRELKLLGKLLDKTNNGGKGAEVLGVCPMGAYIRLKCERDNKEDAELEAKKARDRLEYHRTGIAKKLDFGDDEPKRRKNKEVKCEFEDEEKEETGEDE